MTTVYDNTAGTSLLSEEQEHYHHSTKKGVLSMSIENVFRIVNEVCR